MNVRRSKTLLLLLGLLVVVGLPVAGKLARREAGSRCEFDGQAIEPIYQVRIVDGAGASRRFCCLRCAEQWLSRRNEPPATVFVTDEAGGGEVDSRSAVFVRSSVATNAVTGNRIHAFRDPAAAQVHAGAYSGWVLDGAERPLR